MRDEIFLIYALVDPRVSRFGELRYIGQTTQLLKNRLIAHIYNAKNGDSTHHTANWIRAIIREDLVPEIRLLQICKTRDQMNSLEKLLIGLGKLHGNLTNSADGGSTPMGPETRAKISAANTGKKHKPRSIESREKSRESALKRSPPTNVTREKIRMVARSRPPATAETKAKRRTAALNLPPRSPEWCANIRNAQQNRSPVVLENMRAAQKRRRIRERAASVYFSEVL